MENRRILVIGYQGNMGRRYTSILDDLLIPWFGIEASGIHWDNQRKEKVSGLDTNPFHSIILATPTNTHMAMIKKYRNMNIPILCEKPISFEMEDIDYIIRNKIQVSMVNQYKFLAGKSGVTYYNYFKTGNDGLGWDCINIIGLAYEKPFINNTSSKWKCCINGKELNISMIDDSYIEMIKHWMDDQRPDFEYMKKAHSRVLEGFYDKSNYRDTSENDIKEIAGEGSKRVTRRKNSTGESDTTLPV